MRYDTPDPALHGSVARSIRLAFGGDKDEDALNWMDRLGHEYLRVVVSTDGHLEATAALVPMAQCFGGRAVPMEGVVGVTVPPESRGRGSATALMTEMVREMHERRVPISTLYPATQPLYRRVGFEQAGARFEWTISVREMVVDGPDAPGVELRPAVEGDEEAIEACAERVALSNPGGLVRGPYCWSRVHWDRMHERRHDAVVILMDGEVRGFLYYRLTRPDAMERGREMILRIAACAAEDGPAAAALLRFIAQHRSVATSCTLYQGAGPGMLAMLREQPYRAQLVNHWMLRVTHAEEAISARGFAPGVSAEVVIDLADDTIPEQSGAWALRVSGGAGELTRCDAGVSSRAGVRMTERDLAALYSGYMSAAELSRLGRVEGDAASLASLDACFASAMPWLSDAF
ncbi:MAG: GNAT family N-acetyltransferase [Planctomycetota bacterium]